MDARHFQVLQPLKSGTSLESSWDVVISEELLEYLTALEQISGKEAYLDLNFTQAALLVQNSALAYSKKVDMLYEFVFKTLESLSLSNNAATLASAATAALALSKRKQNARTASSSSGTTEASLAVDLMDSGFIPLDELVEFKASANNTSHSTHQLERRSTTEQVGLARTCLAQEFLLGRSEEEFNVSRLSIDPNSGLLQLDQAQPLEQQQEEAELQTSPVQHQQQEAGETTAAGMEETADFAGFDDNDAGADYSYNAEEEEEKKVAAPPPPRMPVVEAEFLDPHAQSTKRKDRPFKRGETHAPPQLPNRVQFQQALLLDHPGLDLMGQDDGMEMERDWSILSLVGWMEKPGAKLSQLFFPEFEQQRARRRKELRALLAEDDVEQGEMQARGEEVQEDYVPDEQMYYGDENDNSQDDDSFTNEANTSSAGLVINAAQFEGAEAAEEERVLESYAQVVRNHVNRFLEDCRNWAQESKLSLRVNNWHLHLEPILEREATRPVFDLKQSQMQVLDNFPAHAVVCSFDVLVAGGLGRNMDKENVGLAGKQPQPQQQKEGKDGKTKSAVEKWQVCRIFLTTLVLANSGSLRIVEDGMEESDAVVCCPTEREFQAQDSFTVECTEFRPTTPRLPKKRMRPSLIEL